MLVTVIAGEPSPGLGHAAPLGARWTDRNWERFQRYPSVPAFVKGAGRGFRKAMQDQVGHVQYDIETER